MRDLEIQHNEAMEKIAARERAAAEDNDVIVPRSRRTSVASSRVMNETRKSEINEAIL